MLCDSIHGVLFLTCIIYDIAAFVVCLTGNVTDVPILYKDIYLELASILLGIELRRSTHLAS